MDDHPQAKAPKLTQGAEQDTHVGLTPVQPKLGALAAVRDCVSNRYQLAKRRRRRSRRGHRCPRRCGEDPGEVPEERVLVQSDHARQFDGRLSPRAEGRRFAGV